MGLVRNVVKWLGDRDVAALDFRPFADEVITDPGDLIEFKPYGKTPRWGRSTTVEITEKIDGSNGAVIVTENGTVAAQSRNRLVTQQADNAGFAKWVYQNAEGLRRVLGAGHHYGEWYGSGIQGNRHGLPPGEKRFALFVPYKYQDRDLQSVPGLEVVPTLYSGPLDPDTVDVVMASLKAMGSQAGAGRRPGGYDGPYLRPEGVIIYRNDTRQTAKATFDNPEGKWRDGSQA